MAESPAVLRRLLRRSSSTREDPGPPDSAARSSTRGRRRGARIWPGLLLLLGTAYLYRESPVFQFGDASFTLLTSTALLDGNGLAVESYLPRWKERRRLPYNLTVGREHLLPWYPPGTAILSTPLFLAMKPFGYRAVNAEGVYDHSSEVRAMRYLGPFLAAVFVLLAYFVATELLPTRWALAVAGSLAVASPAWSGLSRSLWSHNWLVILVTVATWLLVRAERRGSPPSPEALATLLAWAFFVRPTGAPVLLAAGIYLLVRWRRTILRYVVMAAMWSAAFVYWSWNAYGRLVPPYYSQGWTLERACGESMTSALAGVLIAPSRGLLVFCPWILLTVWVLWRYRHHVRHPGLLHLAWPLCLAQVWIVADSSRWWGGYCYGPRLMSDVLPWLFLLGVLAVDAWRRGPPRSDARGRSAEIAVGTVLVLLTVALHAPGALSTRTHRWNQATRCGLGLRVWEWSNPQFLAWRTPRDPAAATDAR
ncbi:MAG: glycosyltransferase family 39 protein [Thermoanaerobaculia bacterium]